MARSSCRWSFRTLSCCSWPAPRACRFSRCRGQTRLVPPGWPTYNRPPSRARPSSAEIAQPPYGLESTKRSEQSVGTPPGSGRPGPGRAPQELAAPARVAAATRRSGRGQWLIVPAGEPGGARPVAVERLLSGGPSRARHHPAVRPARRREGSGRGLALALAHRDGHQGQCREREFQRLQITRAHLGCQSRRPAFRGAVPVLRPGEEAVPGARAGSHLDGGERRRDPRDRRPQHPRCPVGRHDAPRGDTAHQGSDPAHARLLHLRHHGHDGQSRGRAGAGRGDSLAARRQHGAGRGSGVALRAARGGLRAVPGSDAPAAVHGRGRERAVACAQGADRLSCGRQHVLPAHREAAGEERGARGRAGHGSPRQRRPEGGFGDGRSPRAGRALMSSRLFPLFIGAGVLLVLAALSLFSVNETEFAIRTEFGKIVGIDYTPGLHMKWPWDVVTKFDSRILSQSYTGETFLTNDGRGLIVDFYVKWRVKNPSLYFMATGGLVDLAGERLAEIVKDGIKSVVAQRTLQQIVSAERAAVTGQMFGQASRNAAGLGVDLVDVRVQRIDLPDEVAARVYESMKQSFAKTASRLRAEGQSASAGIRASAERQRTVILADAERDALRVRGEGDAIAAQTYARAYSKNPEFYAFYRSLQAYERSLGKDGDLLVVTPDGDFFKYLKDPSKAAAPRR